MEAFKSKCNLAALSDPVSDVTLRRLQTWVPQHLGHIGPSVWRRKQVSGSQVGRLRRQGPQADGGSDCVSRVTTAVPEQTQRP